MKRGALLRLRPQTRWGPKLVRAERGRRGEEGVWATNTLSVMDVGGGSGPRQSVCRVVGG